MTSIINLAQYPLHQIHSPVWTSLVHKCSNEVFSKGVAVLPNFVQPNALQRMVLEAQTNAHKAFTCMSKHNVLLVDQQNPQLPTNHIRNEMYETKVASIAYDELSQQGALNQVSVVPLYCGVLCC